MRRMLFVDDHPIYRDGLRRAILGMSADMDFADVEGVSAALARLERDHEFDLCLVDHRLGDGEGLDLARKIRTLYPTIAVGMLTAAPARELASELRRIGGVACLAKSRNALSLCRAIDALFRGELVFDEDERTEPGEVAISKRKREVLALASAGMQDKQIGKQLAISESTVRHHWKQIFMRLGAGNRAEAVSKAHQSRLLGAGEPKRTGPGN